MDLSVKQTNQDGLSSTFVPQKGSRVYIPAIQAVQVFTIPSDMFGTFQVVVFNNIWLLTPDVMDVVEAPNLGEEPTKCFVVGLTKVDGTGPVVSPLYHCAWLLEVRLGMREG